MNTDKLNQIKSQANLVFNSRFLKKLTPIERYEFIQLCHRRSYNAGEFIYHQGDPGTGIYFVEEGEVELIVQQSKVQQGEIDDESDDRTRFKIGPSESFGALSMGYDLRRMSTARCCSDCTLLGFFKPDFETLKNRHPHIAVKILDVLSMIALKQLDVTTQALINETDVMTAFSVQFKTYYNQIEPNEEDY